MLKLDFFLGADVLHPPTRNERNKAVSRTPMHFKLPWMPWQRILGSATQKEVFTMQPVGEACLPTEVAIIELPHDIMLKSCDLDHNFFFLYNSGHIRPNESPVSGTSCYRWRRQ